MTAKAVVDATLVAAAKDMHVTLAKSVGCGHENKQLGAIARLCHALLVEGHLGVELFASRPRHGHDGRLAERPNASCVLGQWRLQACPFRVRRNARPRPGIIFCLFPIAFTDSFIAHTIGHLVSKFVGYLKQVVGR